MYEAAADLYTKAAAGFRVLEKYGEAGEAFEKAAGVQDARLKEPLDAALSMLEASKAYRTESCDRPEDALLCLEFAIGIYCRLGKGNCLRAAKLMKDAAELHETKLRDGKKAVECYETAAEWYKYDRAIVSAGSLFQKAADVSALNGDYRKAIDHYEPRAVATEP